MWMATVTDGRRQSVEERVLPLMVSRTPTFMGSTSRHCSSSSREEGKEKQCWMTEKATPHGSGFLSEEETHWTPVSHSPDSSWREAVSGFSRETERIEWTCTKGGGWVWVLCHTSDLSPCKAEANEYMIGASFVCNVHPYRGFPIKSASSWQ